MFKFFFWCLAPAFAALPALSEVRSEEISSSNASSENLVGQFSLTGDSLKTPFVLQFVFENCGELKSRRRGKILPFTALRLKYVKTQTSTWETINLKPVGRDKNCIQDVEFYEDVQEKYNIELWASMNTQKAIAGIYRGRIFFNVLPKP